MMMRTNVTNPAKPGTMSLQNAKKTRSALWIVFLSFFLMLGTLPVSAHCDSFDGPTVKDAIKALETNNVGLVLKWISPEQEDVVVPLFQKTYALKTGDLEVYKIVEQYFFETLVRLHRETEGAPFTGLKPAGTAKKIVQLSDQALDRKDIEGLLTKLNNHLGKVLRGKYEKVVSLEKVKDKSAANGREYVAAYVDYTHTIEAIHDIADRSGAHVVHKH